MNEGFNRALWELDGVQVQDTYTRWFKSQVAEDKLPEPLPTKG